MTREEYQAKLDKLHPQFDCDLVAMLKAEYMKSLEAEKEKLEKAIEKAAHVFFMHHGCPFTKYEWQSTRYKCDACDCMNADSTVCWLDWLMGAK